MDQAESLRRMMRNQRRMTSPTNTTKGSDFCYCKRQGEWERQILWLI